MSPRTVQGVLIPNEDLRADLAAFVPAASKITDAAAAYIAKADKAYGDETVGADTLAVVRESLRLAQEVVRFGAAMGELLRNPSASLDRLREWQAWREVNAGGTPDGERAVTLTLDDLADDGPDDTGADDEPDADR